MSAGKISAIFILNSKYALNHKAYIIATRSRYRRVRKKDNAHVEQKYCTHVRPLFGYDSFEDSTLVALMNDLYAKEWSLYQNHFIPSMKLLEKNTSTRNTIRNTIHDKRLMIVSWHQSMFLTSKKYVCNPFTRCFIRLY